MSARRLPSVATVVLMASALVPTTAAAQSAGAIAGTVRDTTGGVLPGVTVEAASPALIEKTRNVVTDERGQYRIVDLRPGIYIVTFTLAGFGPVRQEGIELQEGLTSPVNGSMRVGGVQESLTVSAAAPIVDVQNVSQRQVVSRDVIDAVPSSKVIFSMAALIPSIFLGSA